ncbi:MAG: M48 family metallopeptidase [Clostridia bacterium]|nr:M48 family metallopeptidase [Clostridia bacterium]
MDTLHYLNYDFRLTRRKGCKRLIVKVPKGEGCFVLTVPYGTALDQVKAFLTANRDWLDQHASWLQTWTPAFALGERHWAQGLLVTLGQDGVPSGKAFLVWRQRRLEAIISQYAPVLSGRLGRCPTEITFRNMNSRWGSCTSSTGRIRLSTNLGCVPEKLAVYVLAHELCHLVEANHSAAFYGHLAQLFPDWQRCREELKAFRCDPLPPLE